MIYNIEVVSKLIDYYILKDIQVLIAGFERSPL